MKRGPAKRTKKERLEKKRAVKAKGISKRKLSSVSTTDRNSHRKPETCNLGKWESDLNRYPV